MEALLALRPRRPPLDEDGVLAGAVDAQLVVEIEHVEVGLRHLFLAEDREQLGEEGPRHRQRQGQPSAEERQEEELGEAHLSRQVGR